MKRFAAALTALIMTVLLVFGAGAYAVVEERGENKVSHKTPDDVWFEDFSSCEEGAKPTSFRITESSGQIVEVVTMETPDSKNSNVLKLSDTNTASSSINLPVPKMQGPVTFKMRFKFRRTLTDGFGFILNFTGDSGTNAFRIVKFSAENDTFSYVNNAGNNIFTRALNFHDEWFTITVRWDNDLRQTGILFEGESLATQKPDLGRYSNNAVYDKNKKNIMVYSQPWFNEFTDPEVTKLTLATYGSTAGDYFIDYMKFMKDVEEFKPVKERAPAKKPELTEDPVARLVPGKVNIVFKGEIKYFGNPVKTINSRTMVDARIFGSWYNMTLKEGDEGYELTGDGKTISFAKESLEFSLDGAANKTDTPPQVINNCIYIPLRSFCEALGDTVSWSDELSCVTVE